MKGSGRTAGASGPALFGPTLGSEKKTWNLVRDLPTRRFLYGDRGAAPPGRGTDVRETDVPLGRSARQAPCYGCHDAVIEVPYLGDGTGARHPVHRPPLPHSPPPRKSSILATAAPPFAVSPSRPTPGAVVLLFATPAAAIIAARSHQRPHSPSPLQKRSPPAHALRPTHRPVPSASHPLARAGLSPPLRGRARFYLFWFTGQPHKFVVFR